MRGDVYRPTWVMPGPNPTACPPRPRGALRHAWEPVGTRKPVTLWRCQRCGATRRQSEVYWARYSKGGKLIRESTEQTKAGEAENFLNAHLDPLRPVMPNIHKVTFDELADAYLKHSQAKGLRDLEFAERCVERLKAHFGGWRANRITMETIDKYVTWRQGKGGFTVGKGENAEQKPYSNGSINRDLAVLRRIFRLGRRAGKVLLVPEFEMLREAPPRQGFVGDVDFLALEAAVPEYLRLPTAFKYTYGWRKEAVFTLTWDKLDLRDGTVALDARYSKNGEPVMVRLAPTLWARFRTQWQRTVALVRARTPEATPQAIREAVPWVFHRDGKPIRDFRTAWKAACTAIGRPGLVPHDLRRSAARNYDRRGISRSVAMQMAGWKTDAIYRRYRIVNDEDLRDAAAKLEAGAFAAPLPPPAQQGSSDLAPLPHLASE